MNKQTEALKLALEALTHLQPTALTSFYTIGDRDKAITAIREALAEQQAQQDNPHPEYCKGYAAGLEAGAISEKKSVQQQEPVAWINWCAATGKRSVSFECESELASQPLYEGITQNTQAHYSKFHSWFDSELHRQKYTKDHPAFLAAQEAWNAANDAAQHRINRLNAEIEAWKVRFKIAEDALAKLNGPEQKPVAKDAEEWGGRLNQASWAAIEAWDAELMGPMPGSVFNNIKGVVRAAILEYVKNYTSPPASKPWVGLSTDEIYDMYNEPRSDAEMVEFARAIEAKLREKNS